MFPKDNEASGMDTFSPSRKYRGLLYQYLLLLLPLFLIFWIVPAAVFAPFFVVAISAVLVFLLYAFLFIWIRKYFATIRYSINEDSIRWQRGVWFRSTGIVTYNKITNIDIGQGPLSRRKGLASLKIQTAGYSANKSSAEININGIVEYEALRDKIMEHVRGAQGKASVDVKKPDEKLLQEVSAIRRLLEEKMKG